MLWMGWRTSSLPSTDWGDGDQKQHTLLYDYNKTTREFKELVETRLHHQEADISNLVKVGDDLYFAGASGKVMKIRFEF